MKHLEKNVLLEGHMADGKMMSLCWGLIYERRSVRSTKLTLLSRYPWSQEICRESSQSEAFAHPSGGDSLCSINTTSLTFLATDQGSYIIQPAQPK